MYASIFIIPMRVMMWSAGIACFTESPDFRSVAKKIAVHPCIVAVYIGLGLMVFAKPLDALYGAFLARAVPVAGTVVPVDFNRLGQGGALRRRVQRPLNHGADRQ